jgi:hypothetical protein
MIRGYVYPAGNGAIERREYDLWRGREFGRCAGLLAVVRRRVVARGMMRSSVSRR